MSNNYCTYNNGYSIRADIPAWWESMCQLFVNMNTINSVLNERYNYYLFIEQIASSIQLELKITKTVTL